MEQEALSNEIVLNEYLEGKYQACVTYKKKYLCAERMLEVP